MESWPLRSSSAPVPEAPGPLQHTDNTSTVFLEYVYKYIYRYQELFYWTPVNRYTVYHIILYHIM